MIASVFVYKDGTVGRVELPVDMEPANWRRVVRSAMSVSVSKPPVMITADTEEFDRRGRMFDGRPVYCATGFDVKEVRQCVLVAERAATDDGVYTELRRAIDRFLEAEYPDAISLDSWDGAIPFTPDEDAAGLAQQHIVKRGARRLVAVKAAKPQPTNGAGA